MLDTKNCAELMRGSDFSQQLKPVWEPCEDRGAWLALLVVPSEHARREPACLPPRLEALPPSSKELGKGLSCDSCQGGRSDGGSSEPLTGSLTQPSTRVNNDKCYACWGPWTW